MLPSTPGIHNQDMQIAQPYPLQTAVPYSAHQQPLQTQPPHWLYPDPMSGNPYLDSNALAVSVKPSSSFSMRTSGGADALTKEKLMENVLQQSVVVDTADWHKALLAPDAFPPLHFVSSTKSLGATEDAVKEMDFMYVDIAPAHLDEINQDIDLMRMLQQRNMVILPVCTRPCCAQPCCANAF